MLVVQGFIDNKKKKNIDLSKLFNVDHYNANAKTLTIQTRSTVVTTEGAAAVPAQNTCNGIPVTCNTGSWEDYTASYPIQTNEIFNDCDYDELPADDKNKQMEKTAKDWVYREARFGYNAMLSQDKTTEILALNAANVYEEIAAAIKYLNDTSGNEMIDLSEITIALDESISLDLAALNLACCDLAVRTDEPKSTAAKAFQVSNVVAVPKGVLSGNISGAALTPQTTVKFRVYYKMDKELFIYCKKPLKMGAPAGAEYYDGSQIIGKEFVGFANKDVNGMGAVHMFYADTIMI